MFSSLKWWLKTRKFSPEIKAICDDYLLDYIHWKIVYGPANKDNEDYQFIYLYIRADLCIQLYISVEIGVQAYWYNPYSDKVVTKKEAKFLYSIYKSIIDRKVDTESKRLKESVLSRLTVGLPKTH